MKMKRRDFLKGVGAVLLTGGCRVPFRSGAPLFLYDSSGLKMDAVSVRDSLRTIRLEDLRDVQPACPVRLQGVTPLTERLWRVALGDIEKNIVTAGGVTYFGAGKEFGASVYERDIAFSGVLGCNALYPDIMLSSFKFTRALRRKLGFTTSRSHAIAEIPAPWEPLDLAQREYFLKFHTNEITRRTDDVIWIWAAEDLLMKLDQPDWAWLYSEGTWFFENIYRYFYDESDGLYRGQATFVDVHMEFKQQSGYPTAWGLRECIMSKAVSTNALYFQAMEVLSRTASRLGHSADAVLWAQRADDLKKAMCREMRHPDGTFTYLKTRDGKLLKQRHALGEALAVRFGVVEGDEARAALAGYPVTDAGVPLIYPFFNHPDNPQIYHDQASWPFADTFFLAAKEKAFGIDCTAQNAALLARTCVQDGTFHEVVNMNTKEPFGSGSQLWSAAAFIDVCRRAGKGV
jgi:hypothetical protein